MGRPLELDSFHSRMVNVLRRQMDQVSLVHSFSKWQPYNEKEAKMEGRLLKIDLSDQSYSIEDISSEILEKYIGGRGLGAYLLYNLVDGGVDPLGPKNQLIFSAGPAQGTSLHFSPKAVLSTKSPLTGIYLYCVSSGTFAHSLRKAGFFAVAIRGMASSPVYLWINNDRVEFKDATKLWGMKSYDAQKGMLDEIGQPKASTLSIGPAGEKLMEYAAVMTDGTLYRAFGRGGCGSVMGSKKLKGIVLAGDKEIALGDTKAFEQVKKKITEKIKNNQAWAEMRRKYGTGADMVQLNELGILPTRNWQGGTFEGVEGICPVTTEKEWPRKNLSCGPFCPVPCSHSITIGKGPYKGAYCDGPEYETFYSFGSNCGVDKFDAIVAAEQICDEEGIDTMSAGCSIGFAMECFEKGLISLKDTDGIELRFGNDQAMIAMLRKIVNRKGLGELLSAGVRKASQEIPGSESFAMHVKGMELGGYECRGLNGQALQFAINNRGGGHHAYGLPARIEGTDGTRLEVAGKGALVRRAAIGRIVCDSLTVCTFVRNLYDNQTIVEALSSLSGEDWSVSDIETVGERVMAQERLFNMREGITSKDDTLPERLLKEPKPDGPTKGIVVPLDALKEQYYEVLGWDKETGNPTDDVLQKLGVAK